jgi:hypothetical protein
MLGLALLATTLLGAGVPVLLNAPTVVVYPLLTNGGLEPEIGSRISVMLATSISAIGGVSVKPAPPGTVQSDYLSTARKLGVDYYISGFVTPLGQQASVVEQVVSALSGSVVWSNTALISTYGDAQGQGPNLRSAILAHAGRAFASLDAGEQAPPPNPQATAKEANLQILGPKKSKNNASDATVATAGPSKFAVLTVGGNDDVERKAYATSSVLRALKKHRVTAALSSAATQDATSSATAICAQTGASVLLGGTLVTQNAAPASATTANIVVTAFDCAGHQIGEQTASRDANGKRGWQVAIDRAIDAAVNDYLTKRTSGG